MICNPARFFINSSEDRRFTYEGGSRLFHWSPNDSGLSETMESNVIFFADDESHARDVLRRLFEFWIECNDLYKKSQQDGLDARTSEESATLRYYLKNMGSMQVTLAPTNQFYQVTWAWNDTLNMYARR